MGLFSKGVTIASAAAGLAVLSQAPEYAQQYRQRLGGAVEELRVVVADFDRDAENSQLTRRQALDEMQGSPTRFARDRGASMERTIRRFEALFEQRRLLDQSAPIARPLFVLRNPDSEIANGAWQDFEPAVPLNVPGAVYGGLGALIALLLARLAIGAKRQLRRSGDDGRIRVEPPRLDADGAGEGAQPSQIDSTHIKYDAGREA
jgi:Protein of unknown function (DUF2937)